MGHEFDDESEDFASESGTWDEHEFALNHDPTEAHNDAARALLLASPPLYDKTETGLRQPETRAIVILEEFPHATVRRGAFVVGLLIRNRYLALCTDDSYELRELKPMRTENAETYEGSVHIAHFEHAADLIARIR